MIVQENWYFELIIAHYDLYRSIAINLISRK